MLAHLERPATWADPDLSMIVWLRHAESTWNALGRWQGHSDPSLSEKGRAQALALGDELVPYLVEQGATRIVSSDLRRARETAEAVGEALTICVETDRRLRERDLGVWSGLQTHQVRAGWPEAFEALRRGDPSLRPPKGETLLEVRARVREWLTETRARDPENTLLAVSHGALLRALFPGRRFANTESFATPRDALWHTLSQEPVVGDPST